MGPVLLALAGVGGLVAFGVHVKRRQELHTFVLGQLRRAAAIIEVSAPPLIANIGVANAASDGARIHYNPVWVEGVLARHCSDGTCQTALVLATMAHEIAHHANQDAIRADLHAHEKGAEGRRIAPRSADSEAPVDVS